MMSGSKRRQSIKRQAYKDFCPNEPPTFWWGGKILTDVYDKQCYLEGYHKAEGEHDSMLKRLEEEEADG